MAGVVCGTGRIPAARARVLGAHCRVASAGPLPDQYRETFEATQTTSDLPWPFALPERADQDAPAAARRVVEVVQRNTAQLRQIVTRHGCPGRSRVGEDGADAAWLVLQHASSGVSTLGTPANLAFCRSCVPLLETAVSGGKAHPRHLEATVDSLRRADRLPPVFAVLALDYQIVNDEPVFAMPVNVATIDEQRARIGLPPLSSDLNRRAQGDSLDPAGPGRAEPWPAPARSTHSRDADEES